MRADVAELVTAAGLDPARVAGVVATALAEDLPGPGAVDATTAATVAADTDGVAGLVARAAGVVAGLPVAAAVFTAVEPSVRLTLLATDGDRVGPGQALLRVAGPVRGLLTAERTALNVLCHLSGVATATRRWVDAVDGTGAVVRDTRKTLPGLRALEKYAVRCGGGANHRMSLVDAALVKDNHVVAAGGVAAAFDAVRTRFPELPVEVECDTLAQVEAAVAAGAELILLDNMSTDDLRRAVALVAGRCRLEASGGLSLAGARAVAGTGVDYLAVGALTHSVLALDVGMDLEPAVDGKAGDPPEGGRMTSLNGPDGGWERGR